MESNDPREQLAEATRLQSATIEESSHTPRGAFLVMGVAAALFFSGYALDLAGYAAWAPMIWLVFVTAWLVWLRRGIRAIPGRAPRSRAEWRRDVLQWVGLFVVANLIVIAGSQVSWLLVGLLMAALGTVGGLTARREARS